MFKKSKSDSKSYGIIGTSTSAPTDAVRSTIALAFPFLNKNGIEFKLDAVDFLRLPSSQ